MRLSLSHRRTLPPAIALILLSILTWQVSLYVSERGDSHSLRGQFVPWADCNIQDVDEFGFSNGVYINQGRSCALEGCPHPILGTCNEWGSCEGDNCKSWCINDDDPCECIESWDDNFNPYECYPTDRHWDKPEDCQAEVNQDPFCSGGASPPSSPSPPPPGPGGCGDGSVDADGVDDIVGPDPVTGINDDEECDDGTNNSDTDPDACRTNCKNPSCGDGVTDTGELCDEGNQNGAGSCTATCSTCSNGVCDANECGTMNGGQIGADQIICTQDCKACSDGCDNDGDGDTDTTDLMCNDITISLANAQQSSSTIAFHFTPGMGLIGQLLSQNAPDPAVANAICQQQNPQLVAQCNAIWNALNPNVQRIPRPNRNNETGGLQCNALFQTAVGICQPTPSPACFPAPLCGVGGINGCQFTTYTISPLTCQCVTVSFPLALPGCHASPAPPSPPSPPVLLGPLY